MMSVASRERRPPAPLVHDVDRRNADARALLEGEDVARAIRDLRALMVPGLEAWVPGPRASVRADLQSRGWPSHQAVQLIPDTVCDVATHVALAASLDHPATARAGDVHPDVAAVHRWIASQDASYDFAGARTHRCRILRSIAHRLEPVERHLDALRPPSVAAIPRRAKCAFMYACLEAVGAPDTIELVLGFITGFACVGDIPDSGWWRPEEKPATWDFSETDHDDWVNDLERECSREWKGGRTREDCAHVHSRTQEEVIADLMQGPFTRAEMDAAYGRGRWRPLRRFGVWQKGKCRGCDNGRTSGTNLASGFHERMVCESADFPARASACAARAHGRPVAMEGGTEDLPDAYRYCPARDPRYTTVCLLNPSGAIEYYTMGGFNFGLASAVPQFNRMPEGATMCARRLLGVSCCHYYDDFDVTEPRRCGASGQAALRVLMELWGFPFAERKSFGPAPQHVFLGVENDLSPIERERVVYLSVPADRIDTLHARLSGVLERGTLRSAESSSLAGSLGFALLWGFCRFGRAAMQPLYERARRSDSCDELTAGERSSLEFFLSILGHIRPCR